MHEFLDLEMTMKSLGDSASVHVLADLLQGLTGLKDVTITGDKVSLRYEPVLLTRAELVVRIHRAGLEIAKVDTAASPVVDALIGTINAGIQHHRRPVTTGDSASRNPATRNFANLASAPAKRGQPTLVLNVRRSTLQDGRACPGT